VWNLPNLISLVRVFMVPLLFLVFYHPSPLRNLWAAGIFAVASLTDFLDGYLARRWKLSSALGAFLDPVRPAQAMPLYLLLSNNLFPWAASP
jgi:CDP-diacylglycerol--glycerol-3-phosphate 3-phosphatidyltransferase